MTLYEITADLMNLQEMLMESPDDQCLMDTLESVEFDLAKKSDGYCKIIKNLQAESQAYAEEIARFQEKKRTADKAIDRLKASLESAMKAIGKDKVKGNLFTISLRNNAQQLPKDLDMDKVPSDFLIPQEPKIDKRELLRAVKDGKVDGIDLVRSQSLQIK